MAFSIGKLIENEIRKQQLDVSKTAKELHTSRTNLYNVFRRSNIDVKLLSRFSKLLNHNFFQDLADNLELIGICNEEKHIDDRNRKALAQFWKVIPDILKELNMNYPIIFGTYDIDGISVPDYGLGDSGVCFTIGERLWEKWNKETSEILTMTPIEYKKGVFVDLWSNKLYGSTLADIKIDFKTKEEWKELMLYVRDNIIPKLHITYTCL